jgi:hypothetical protein
MQLGINHRGPTPALTWALKQRWAHFIKQVYEADPLLCPQCGGPMRILAFIEPACADTADRQPEVVDLPVPRADRGLWPARAHSPPAGYPVPFSLQRVVAA